MGRTFSPALPCRLCGDHTRHRWDADQQACRFDLHRKPVCPACAERLADKHRQRSA